MGEEDGVPKTPKWASEKCGVPVYTIKALARHWAKKTVSICHGNGGSYIRGPYSTEPARLEIMLLAMQGLGRPGVHQTKMLEWNLWAQYYPVPYTPEFSPAVPHIADPLHPVDGDVPDEINMARFRLSPVQEEGSELKKRRCRRLSSSFPAVLSTTRYLTAAQSGTAYRSSPRARSPEGNHRLATSRFQFERYIPARLSKVHMIWSSSL